MPRYRWREDSVSGHRRSVVFAVTLALLMALCGPATLFSEVLTPEALLKVQRVTTAVISPNAESIAYVVDVPRSASDDPGASYNELHLYSRTAKISRPFITGKVRVGAPAWSPDGSTIAFMMRRGEKAQTQVWMIPLAGGEAVQITQAEEGVLGFRWHPSGASIGYLAVAPRNPMEKKLESKGYGFVFYEENVRPRNLYTINVDRRSYLPTSAPERGTKGETGAPVQLPAPVPDRYNTIVQDASGAAPGKHGPEPAQLTEGINVWSFEFTPDGNYAAIATSPRNLIDENYMFQKISLLALGDRSQSPLFTPPGKLGMYAFSPDGRHLAVAAARERSDHAVSQAYVVEVRAGSAANPAPVNLTPRNFRGHVNWVGWRDDATILYRAGEGVQTTLSSVKPDGTDRQLLLSSEKTGVVFNGFSIARGFKGLAFSGQSPSCPGDLYFWAPGLASTERLTTLAPELSGISLGTQSVVRYKARDGLEIEGLLLSPVGYEKGKAYPLIVVVHGGPESHYSNGWLTSYSEPGQVLAGKGYAVFYPNYRASTGYGVEFAMQGFGDPGGKEFDDVADGIDHLVSTGIADRERVGLGGGSYGGYAAAWFATYYTRYVRAVVMFVGISNLVSKHGTTDIPYEELYVHSGKPLEELWDLGLKRSPVYWAKQSSTATLICGGTDDARVHPSQSIELFRRMKMNNHPAVRLVQYPGEQHGNAKQPGRTDLLYRLLDWYDWYVRDAKPLQGPMPPLDISGKYGLDLR
jgi:dipeptidyl aminopeptidase/acylaminoacyl peptidase